MKHIPFKSITLRCTNAGSNKLYFIHLVEDTDGTWSVHSDYGSALRSHLDQRVVVTSLDSKEAEKAFARLRREKERKGYSVDNSHAHKSSFPLGNFNQETNLFVKTASWSPAPQTTKTPPRIIATNFPDLAF